MIKELTKYEKYLINNIEMGDNVATRKYETRKNGEWRQLIKNRTLNNASKLLRARQAVEALFQEFKKSQKQNNFRELMNALWKIENAMKFQGYLQAEIAYLEETALMNGKDKELIAEINSQRIKTKLVVKSNSMQV